MMDGEGVCDMLFRVVLAVIAVAVTVSLLAILAECFFRQSDFVEMELLEVSGGLVVGEDGLPYYAGKADNTRGQVCVGERVRVLRKSGGFFGWFPTWYLIERVEDQ